MQGHIEKNNAESPDLAKSVPVRKAPAVTNAWAKGPPTSLASPPLTPVIVEDAWAKGPPSIPEPSPKSLDLDETKVSNQSSHLKIVHYTKELKEEVVSFWPYMYSICFTFSFDDLKILIEQAKK